jgi:hypothetical protein
MKISLGSLETFNVSAVNNTKAYSFFKSLTGGEEFEYTGSILPKAIMVCSLEYNYPERSFAFGFLLSISVEEFENEGQSGKYKNMEILLKKISLGSVHIEFGKDIAKRKVTYNPDLSI